MTEPGRLSHLDDEGAARMVDVSGKETTDRQAVATGVVRTTREVLQLISDGGLPKGDALATARIAGILAAKRTSDLIPLCHPLPLSSIEIAFDVDPGLASAPASPPVVEEGARREQPSRDHHLPASILITATVRTTGRTGVEMEALTAVAVTGLTIHDMIKAVDPAATLDQVRLETKTGGKHGIWARPEDRA